MMQAVAEGVVLVEGKTAIFCGAGGVIAGAVANLTGGMSVDWLPPGPFPGRTRQVNRPAR